MAKLSDSNQLYFFGASQCKYSIYSKYTTCEKRFPSVRCARFDNSALTTKCLSSSNVLKNLLVGSKASKSIIASIKRSQKCSLSSVTSPVNNITLIYLISHCKHRNITCIYRVSCYCDCLIQLIHRIMNYEP